MLIKPSFLLSSLSCNGFNILMSGDFRDLLFTVLSGPLLHSSLSTQRQRLLCTLCLLVRFSLLHCSGLSGVPFCWPWFIPRGLMSRRTLELTHTNVVFCIEGALVTPYTQTHTHTHRLTQTLHTDTHTFGESTPVGVLCFHNDSKKKRFREHREECRVGARQI